MNEPHRPTLRQDPAAPRAVRSVRARYARNYPLRVAVLFAGVARDGLLAAFKAFAKSSRRSDPGASDS
ncbi:hypothetical protein [Kitasatospora sp. NPDC005751]|uniref:hypothetical protein n=1 Tax=unclassified Kitasatospora TaxID=2633591 RepID=UPI0033EC8542